MRTGPYSTERVSEAFLDEPCNWSLPPEKETHPLVWTGFRPCCAKFVRPWTPLLRRCALAATQILALDVDRILRLAHCVEALTKHRSVDTFPTACARADFGRPPGPKQRVIRRDRSPCSIS